jgi:protein-S-isoprenylcysteine O-methyltransferase Ste14
MQNGIHTVPDDGLLIRKGFVVCGALVYWTGVLIHVYRIRRHIGKSPNVRPRGLKERILWIGWFSVIIGWIGQPLIIKKQEGTFLFSFIDILYHHPAGIIWGVVLALCGYAGTLWCYATLGENWRMGINRNERTALITHGPYRYVRHPIYLFQILILSGTILLLPTPFSFLVLFIHVVCVVIKALDEEEYLSTMHGTEYRSYLSHTGMLFPSFNALFHSLRKH